MLIKAASLFLTKLIWLLVAVVIGSSLWLVHANHDPHWLNRGGAAIAAVAALAVVLQIMVEMNLEGEKKKLETAIPKAAPEDRPLQRKSAQIGEKRAHEDIGKLERRRLSVALHVVSCAAIGELLHGYGDILAILLIPVAGHG